MAKRSHDSLRFSMQTQTALLLSVQCVLTSATDTWQQEASFVVEDQRKRRRLHGLQLDADEEEEGPGRGAPGITRDMVSEKMPPYAESDIAKYLALMRTDRTDARERKFRQKYRVRLSAWLLHSAAWVVRACLSCLCVCAH